jgi:hypothetical protein
MFAAVTEANVPHGVGLALGCVVFADSALGDGLVAGDAQAVITSSSGATAVRQIPSTSGSYWLEAP